MNMKKLLKEKKTELYHYKDGVKIEGQNEKMSGYCTGLSGDCSWLSGDCTELRGYCTGLSGDLDECEITDEERSNGVNIRDLIEGV